MSLLEHQICYFTLLSNASELFSQYQQCVQPTALSSSAGSGKCFLVGEQGVNIQAPRRL